MTLMRSTSQLATSIDQLTGEANVTKAQLDAKVAMTEAGIVATQAEQTATEAARDEAAAHAADAATHLATVKAGVTYQGITAILAEKAVTAVDVFVYDTSLDSDGGAWRERCQHTSWYSEELNTATRGSRREFPAVAIVVSESIKVTIFDGDDPLMPMWMIFNQGFTQALHPASPKIVMLNGRLVAGGITYDVNCIDFVGDRVGNSLSYRAYNGNIAQRNDGLNYADTGTADWFAKAPLINRAVNHVAISILPSAPLDPTTGLPVPTVAAATDGGVSVIKDDGTVQHIYNADGVNRAKFVGFSPDGLIYCELYDDNRGLRFFPVPDNHIIQPNHYTAGYAAEWYGDFAYKNGNLQMFGQLTGGGGFPNQICAAAGTEVVRAVQNVAGAVSRVSRDPGAPTQGLVCYSTASHISGWMPGGIKGAYLADTATSPLAEYQIVSDPGFDTGDGWTIQNPANGTWTIANGVARCTSGSVVFLQGPLLQIGKAYVAEFEVKNHVSGTARLYNDGANTYIKNVSENGIHRVSFVATSATWKFVGYETDDFDLDNVYMWEADHDRSSNKNGLVVHGTVLRSSVIEDAELTSYSGFSEVNYLEASLKGYLPAGSSSSLCLMGWFKTNSSGSVIAVGIDIPDVFSGGANGFGLTKGWSGYWAERATNVGYTSTTVTSNEWQLLVLTREPLGTKIYSNGVLTGSTGAVYPTSENPILRVGNAMDGSGFFNGAMALLRISATAPTPDQIKKIYEDERKLFQPGAQCTLYGTSDAVTALAYDPKTNLLHVGTSAGRSTFDGLVRVANTETPVGTAISAVNGLIAEQ